ncbi:hypothetical protein B484DRAFT_454973 [Ochromonadaceae sp. CCMP2298]|nr:hypothetical protein B484DRAFT_454973 [Ochromonadaceae sp. CCMP2298]
MLYYYNIHKDAGLSPIAICFNKIMYSNNKIMYSNNKIMYSNNILFDCLQSLAYLIPLQQRLWLCLPSP